MPRASSTDLPIARAAGGIRVAVRLTPRAKTDRLDAVAATADGRPVLKVLVKAPPVEGRANAALLRLLAQEWQLARRDLSITAGASSRSKTVEIAGDPERLTLRIAAALAAVPRS